MKGVKMLGNRKLEIKDFPVPKAKDDWVLVKVKVCALCGSDLNAFYRPSVETAYNNNRFIPGHEISGIVEEIDRAENLKIGDRVVAYPFIGCNNCLICEHKLWRDCKDWKVIGFDTDGGQAEYVLLPERNLDRIPEDISYISVLYIEFNSTASHSRRVGI